MQQLSIDGVGKFSDRLKRLAAEYGPIGKVSAFVDWAVHQGLADGLDTGVLARLGLVAKVRQQMKVKKDGLREWVCTGTYWVHRENCTADQHELYCRFLKAKVDQIAGTLQIELSFHIDRWNREVILEGPVAISDDVDDDDI